MQTTYIEDTQHFSMPSTNEAYKQYLRLSHANPNNDPTPEEEQAALHFLSCICDEYLNKQVGDFIEIKMGDTWQR